MHRGLQAMRHLPAAVMRENIEAAHRLPQSPERRVRRHRGR